MLIALAAAMAAAAALVWLVARIYRSRHPSRKMIRRDMLRVRDRLRQNRTSLVAWREEELSLLSLKQTRLKKMRSLRLHSSGTFTSIYGEPLIVYAYKKYGSRGQYALLYAGTSRDEFVYNIQPKKVEIYHNEQPLGVIHPDGALKSARNNQTIARYLPAESGLELPVLVHDKPVAAVLTQQQQKFTPRAFEIAAPLDREEEVLFLALGILKLVEYNTPEGPKTTFRLKK